MTNLQKHTKKILEEFREKFFHINEEGIYHLIDNPFGIEQFLSQALSERDEVWKSTIKEIIGEDEIHEPKIKNAAHPLGCRKCRENKIKAVQRKKLEEFLKGDNPTNGEINKDVPTLKENNLLSKTGGKE